MKSVLVIVILTLGFGSFGQTAGYFGKKNVISIDGMGSLPLFYHFDFFNKRTTTYKGESLSEGMNIFDGGLLASFSHAFSPRFGLGIEYALEFGNCNAPNVAYLNHQNSMGSQEMIYYNPYTSAGSSSGAIFMFEQLSMRSMSFIPKIEYTLRAGNLPIGINNQLGIGYSRSVLIEKDYNYSVIDYQSGNVTLDPDRIIDYNNIRPVHNIVFMYAFNIRTPLNRHLMLNYGIRYTLNIPAATGFLGFTENSDNNQPSFDEYFLDSQSIQNNMLNKRSWSIMSLHFGVNYVF